MSEPPPRLHAETLSTALKEIRARRRLKSLDVADAMQMKPRTFEHFESGAGRLNPGRIHRFAEATSSDPYAIMAALALGSPKFAVRCADNKLMTILMVALQEFDNEVGDAIADLDGRTIINTFTRALRDLALQSVKGDAAARAWLEARLSRLAPPTDGDDD
ncbi:helix-turn-helix domain-containing protein [Brevundimonas nasdae]|uniref:Helix-turn-helix domain-containing protein n=1 Tax=Brevundimonas nasdae TaxID=172043 RepID=A0ABX8TJT0_9CAUL|nr:helix-turn-helix transcriptional regulator [Brevundimonas nasdae]QYC11451.1 helix-turn-helix domain-containing protein [Brevundimonas nasdae]QYC14239.1 helix-turn-helix domain-containing protein [Brevundimonas nasdae]